MSIGLLNPANVGILLCILFKVRLLFWKREGEGDTNGKIRGGKGDLKRIQKLGLSRFNTNLAGVISGSWNVINKLGSFRILDQVFGFRIRERIFVVPENIEFRFTFFEAFESQNCPISESFEDFVDVKEMSRVIVFHIFGGNQCNRPIIC